MNGADLSGAELARAERDVALLQRELREHAAESEQLRHLARAMADAPDTQSLLAVLAEHTNVLCDGTLTVVTQVSNDDIVTVIAAAGRVDLVELVQGFQYPLANSLSEAAIQSRSVVVHPHMSEFLRAMPDDSPLQVLNQGYGAGSAIVVPLMAQQEVVGVLASLRLASAPSFAMREERRLRVVADYAAVALRKSRMFEAIDAANQAKSAFLATISHELRTPLTALTGYGELLADEILGPLSNPQLETVERMRAAATHLTVMIDDILSYSSLEAGRERVVVTEVLPANVVRDVVFAMEPPARKQMLALQIDTSANPRPLQSDAEKIRQILANLCDNAIKFTGEGGTVSVAVHDDPEGWVRFTVRDTGIGIAPEHREALFQPFRQLDSGLTRRYGGAGLGLHISRQLAELLGGRIELESALGEGSEFSLVIPRK